MALVGFPSEVSNHCSSIYFDGTSESFSQSLAINQTSTGRFTIKPIEGGNLGYGIGRAMRMAFDSLTHFFSLVKQTASQSFSMPKAFAAKIPASTSKNPHTDYAKKTILDEQSCNPQQISSISTGILVDVIKVAGSYTYLVSGRTDSTGIQIYYTIDPSKPVYLTSIVGNFYDIAVSEKLAYVTLYSKYPNSRGMEAIDISDPLNPSIEGSYNFFNPNTIVTSGKVAYLGDYSDGSVITVNITDPKQLTGLGHCKTAGSAAQRIAFSNDCVLIAEGEDGLQFVNATDPGNPNWVSLFPGSVYDVKASGKYAFIADGDTGLKILDMSNIVKPFLVGAYNISGGSFRLALVSNNYVVVTDSYNTFYIVNIKNPSKPTLAGSFSTEDGAYDLDILQDYVYTVSPDNSNLTIVKLNCPSDSQPNSPDK